MKALRAGVDRLRTRVRCARGGRGSREPAPAASGPTFGLGGKWMWRVVVARWQRARTLASINVIEDGPERRKDPPREFSVRGIIKALQERYTRMAAEELAAQAEAAVLPAMISDVAEVMAAALVAIGLAGPRFATFRENGAVIIEVNAAPGFTASIPAACASSTA